MPLGLSANNPGPASVTTVNTSANYGVSGYSAATSGVIATLAAGPLDLNAANFAGYQSGITNRLLLSAAAGGSTINSIDASGVSDGFTLLIENMSATDALTFAHLAGAIATNGFSNINGDSVTIPPLGAARCTYIINKWQFA